MKTVLLLEDDAQTSTLVTDFLETKDFKVLSAVKAERAIKLYEENESSIEYVLTDYDLKPEEGDKTPLDLLEVLSKHKFKGRAIAISSYEPSNKILKENGCSHICAKPFKLWELLELLT